jgi:hypothetical protein
MGGGLMQLVAYGAQDVYLTGNAQITFWKVVYRRHTNFAIETIEHTLTGNPDFGRKASATIIRNGDLAYRINLMVTLESVSWNPRSGRRESDDCERNLPRFAWVRRLGHALIRHVGIDIGGSEIDKQYGIWLDIWHELTHTNDQESGYRAMIGDVDDLTRLETPNRDGNIKDQYTMYIPLQFWFCRNSGLALPLIALQYHEVRIWFEFEDVNKLIVWQTDEHGSTPDLKGLHMKEASILVDYVYLDSVERRRFAQVGHEYLIEQVQFTGDESITGNSKTANVLYKSTLGFNHPCKELIWVVRNNTFAGDDRSSGSGGIGHSFLAYTHDNNHWGCQALREAANNIANGMIDIGHHGVAIHNPDLTETEVHVPLTGPVVTADLRTRNHPQHDIRFNIFVNGSGANYITFQRYPLYNGVPSSHGATGFNFADYIDEVQVNVDATNGTFVATVISHHLGLNDISVPVGSNGLIDQRYNTNNTGNPNDIFVIQTFNYGLRLDGKGNPVAEAGLQLNGHERFAPRKGGYFNYVQPWQTHTHTPADGINVYSFALHPEQHQPSGSCNLSRIDKTVLILRLNDYARNLFGKGSLLQIDVSDSKLFTFAFSYNVLRIMSGMGGLAYSN